MAEVIHLSDQNFIDELQQHACLLVDFWAPWCGPCLRIAPILDKIAADRDDVVIAKVDIDANPRSAQAFRIQSIPTMILFRNGQAVKQLNGAMPEAALRKELDQLLPTRIH